MSALTNAYIGTYEDELREKHALVFAGESIAEDFDSWAKRAVKLGWLGCPFTPISEATRHERLAVYLQWNGILGFTETIYAIATGDV